MFELLFPNAGEQFTNIFSLIKSILELTVLVVLIIAEWKLLKKMNEKPWKALIPVYNLYLLFKYTWKKSAFWVYIIMSVIFSILVGVANVLVEKPEGEIIAGLLFLVCLPFGVVMAIYSILSSLRLAEAFGRGALFKVGLIFLYSIFLIILSFGRSKYVGNAYERKKLKS